MQFIENVNKEEFDALVTSLPNKHYVKMYAWGEVKKYEGYQVYHIGVKKADKLVICANLLEKKRFNQKYFYIPQGPTFALADKESLSFFLEELKKFIQAKKGLFLRMSINALREDSEHLLSFFQAQGYKHKGFNYGYDGSWDNRHSLWLELDKELLDIENNFSKPRKQCLKKQKMYHIKCAEGTLEQLNIICELEEQLTHLKTFIAHDLKYFETLLSAFDDKVSYVIAYADLKQALINLDAEINSKKFSKDPEALAQKKLAFEKINDLKTKYGESVAVACGIFAFDKDQCWDIYTYNHKAFNFISGTDAIHLYMINKFKQLGIKYYDFCGYSGRQDKQDPDHGLYLYKSSFGAYPVEYLGEFNLVLNKSKYQNYLKVDRLFRKIKRRILYYKNVICKK